MSGKSDLAGLIGLHSEFVGKSEMRVKTRRVGNSAVVMVDVTELGPSTSKRRAEKAARDAARLAGIASTGHAIFDYETSRSANRLDPRGYAIPTAPIRVRNMSFAFGI